MRGGLRQARLRLHRTTEIVLFRGIFRCPLFRGPLIISYKLIFICNNLALFSKIIIKIILNIYIQVYNEGAPNREPLIIPTKCVES